MNIGILKEPDFENRVAFLPEAVKTVINSKNNIIIEKGAGEKSYAQDSAYEEAGAKLSSKEDIYANSDIIIKISPFTEEEIDKIPEGKIICSVLNPLANTSLINKISEKGITAFSLDLIPRTTRGQAMDILSSMATIAGYKAVLNAAGELPHFFPMFMSAAGTIRPAKVLILGAGVAGLQAIATSRKLGAVVEVFDVRSAVKEEVKSLGGKFIEVEGAKEDAAAGGYAVEQTEDFKKKQGQLIHDHAVKSNVVICTAQIPGRQAPLLIKKETVEGMVEGSVIIDLAASTGGNCEVTENDKTIIHKGIKVIGQSNYPSLMPSDASKMFGQNIINFFKVLINEGNLNLDLEDEIIKGTIVCHNKEIINERLKK